MSAHTKSSLYKRGLASLTKMPHIVYIYMSELEKVKRDRFSVQLYESLDVATSKTLEMAYNRISALEEGSSAEKKS